MLNPSEYYSSRITIVGGNDGSGKTLFCMHHPLASKGYFLDLENRYADILVQHPLITKKQYSNCLVLDKNFDVDPLKSFAKITKIITKLINTPSVELIVIDGISDLRRYAADKYLAETKAEAVYGANAWGIVNNSVKKILYRLFNFARAKKKTVICTSWLTPEFDKMDKRTGKMLFDVKPFISSRVDETIALKRSGVNFYIRRGKSPLGPTVYEDCTFDDDGEEEDEEEKPNGKQTKK